MKLLLGKIIQITQSRQFQIRLTKMELDGVPGDTSPGAVDGDYRTEDAISKSSLLGAPSRRRENYSLACLWAEIK